MADTQHSSRERDSGSPDAHAAARQPWLAEGRGVWLALIVAPVLAWCALLVTVYTAVPPSASTGDPLLDRLLGTIAASKSDPALSPWGMPTDARGICEGVLAEWEVEFGDDPRYWMLCYHFARCSTEGYSSEWAEVDLDPRARYLEEARRRGAVDGAVLLRLLRACDRAWREATNQYVAVTPPQHRDETKAPYLQARRAAVDQYRGTEYKLLLSELFAAAPDEALPYYYAAMYETERGNYDAAVDKLRQGNAAPRNTSLTGFPFDELWGGMRAGRPLNDKLVSGRLCEHSLMLALPDFIMVKDTAKLLIAEAIERQDLAALDELHTFGCRFGSAEGTTLIQALLGCVLIVLPLQAVKDQWPEPLSVEARKALDELEAKKDRLRAKLRAIGSPSTLYLAGQLPPRQYWPLYAESLLTGSGSFSLIYLEKLHDDTLLEQQAFGGRIQQLVDEIETFDYTTLSWEQ